MGRWQTRCPRVGKFALVEPGASTLKFYLGPFVEKVPLAVGRFDDDEVVVFGVDVVGDKDRAVDKGH